MKLSVIILNYNVRYFLELCVLSVQKAIENLDAEIIVVDNLSPDDSCQIIKSRFPNVKLIENKTNSGFPKGNNIGVAQAKGDYICILNPDTVVAEDTFEKILAFAELQQNLGIIGCKLIDGSGRFLPESKRGIPTPMVSIAKTTGLYKLSMKHFGSYYASHLSENEIGKVEILVGAFMVLKREVYEEMGGFDEDYFMYGEDIDLSYRVLKSGKSNYYFGDTSVIHYKGESTVKDAKYRKRFQDGMDIFYHKHFSGSRFFQLFMKIGMGFFALAKTIQGKPKNKLHFDKTYLITQNQGLKEQLQQKINRSVVVSETIETAQSFSQNKPLQVVFDNNFIPFKAIISAFESRKSEAVSFRILPQTTDFLIGSDSSNDRGEVLKF